MDARNRHMEVELGLDLIGFVDRAADWCSGNGIRGGSERNVAFAREQPGGGIEPDPTGTGQVNFSPGVEIGEIGLGTRCATVDRLDVGDQLDEVTGDKARGQAELAADLDHEPSGIAARAGLEFQRLLAGLDARFHADDVADFAPDHAVDRDDEVDGVLRLAGDLLEQGLQTGACFLEFEIGLQFMCQDGVILKGEFLGGVLDEEVEGVDRRHVGGQLDLDLELIRLVRENEPRLEVALGVLLPVEEVVLRGDPQAVIQNWRAAMGRRTKTHHLWPEGNRLVVLVVGDVGKGDVNRHGRKEFLSVSSRNYP